MKSLYLLIDFLTVIVPFLFSFHPKLKFYRHFKAFFISNFIVTILFLLWDGLFTRMAVWGFSNSYTLGHYFFNLPAEEVLFFFCIPFACVFTYHCLNLFFKIDWAARTENIFVLILSSLLLITGSYFYDRLYTSVTFISLALLLLLLKYLFKIKWLAKLVVIYPVLLIPFFIVNGLLTGTGPEHPVVWYNDAENMGLRLLTIPVEDIFYGFELILLNVFFYEYLKNRFLPKTYLQ